MVVDKDDSPLGLTRPLTHTYRALGISSGGPFFVPRGLATPAGDRPNNPFDASSHALAGPLVRRKPHHRREQTVTTPIAAEPYRLYLRENQIPTSWYNLRADMPDKPDPIRLPNGAVATHADLAPVFADKLVDQELDDVTPEFPIPDPVLEMYKVYRPSPLCRAYNLERALGTPAKIFYKFEGNNTSGSHKLNSALAQAYYAYEQGLSTITTETGAGQWGTALAEAAAHYHLDLDVFMVRCSYEQKPFRRNIMETFGARVTPLAERDHRDRPSHPRRAPRGHLRLAGHRDIRGGREGAARPREPRPVSAGQRAQPGGAPPVDHRPGELRGPARARRVPRHRDRLRGRRL